MKHLLCEAQQFSSEVVHAVVIIIHKMIYCTIHSHVRLTKSNSNSVAMII